MPRRSTSRRSNEPFLLAMRLLRDEVPSFDRYPFHLPAIRSLGKLPLDSQVTFLVGENGSGKSTLVEAIAVAAGFNPEGGSRDTNFATRRSESELHRHVRLVRSTRRPRTGYFLRAESFYNVGTEADRIAREPGGSYDAYGGASPHEQSHGESFMALVNHRFGPDGLYVLDEPEAALSPQRQLALLVAMHRLVTDGSQFVIATHSPILMAFPGARLLRLDGERIERVAYRDTEHYALTRDFLNDPDRYLRRLLAIEPAPDADD
jgi:predicted ATPase